MEQKLLPESVWSADQKISDEEAWLERIAYMEIEGYPITDIAKMMGTTRDNINEAMDKIDKRRIMKLQGREMDAFRTRSIEILHRVQNEAWRRLKLVPENSKVGSDLLAQVTAAEREIMRLEGTTFHIEKQVGFDDERNKELVRDLSSELTKVIERGRKKSVPEQVESGPTGSPPLLLAPVRPTEPVGPTGTVAPVASPRRKRVRKNTDGG